MTNASFVCKTGPAAMTNQHHKLVVPLKGEIREAWGLGSVWKTCCGTIYGMYFDEESNKYVAMYLGKLRRGGSRRPGESCEIIYNVTGADVTRTQQTSQL